MPHPRRSTIARLLTTALLSASLLTAGIAWWFHRALGFVPPSYQQSLAADPIALAASGDRFERQALEFANSLRHPGAWQLRLADDEINGWLGATLPARFPESLPPNADRPRLLIAEGRLHAAARSRLYGMPTVVSLICEAYLTDQPDELAVRFVRCRAGQLPLPLAVVRDQVASRAARSHIALRWTEEAGYPVAIIRLSPPKATSGIARRIALARLQIDDGLLILEGRTEEAPLPEHELASRGSASHTAQPAESDATQR